MKKIIGGVFKLYPTKHAVERFIERFAEQFVGEIAKELSFESAYNLLKKQAEESIKSFTIREVTFFRYKDMVMPCVKTGNNSYKIKTVLYWHMVEKKIAWANKNRESFISPK